ncbi:MAG: response regulator [Armatimonadota bacterium]|nr:MAG: response regulator [Armatimonadota bacterium]
MKRILVIDDEPPVARLVTAALNTAGVQHSVEYCGDGAQGRTKAARGGYDLITLDIHMPLMGGVEALREAKRSPKSAHIPIVVITGQQDPMFRRRVMKFGAATLVTKPFEIEELGKILSQVLSGEYAEPSAIGDQDPDIRPLDV